MDLARLNFTKILVPSKTMICEIGNFTGFFVCVYVYVSGCIKGVCASKQMSFHAAFDLLRDERSDKIFPGFIRYNWCCRHDGQFRWS